MLDFENLFANPDQFLFAFDGPDAIFAPMDREAYHRSIFMDRRLQAKDGPPTRATLEQLTAAQARAGAEPKPIGYIFHIAHCGSTLLARALDSHDANLVCREPMALRQLGVARAQAFGQLPAPEFQKRLNLLTTLLSRRYNAAGPVIVKANVPVNFMIGPLMDLQPQQPAILLHFGLEPYLLAILKAHQQWVQHISVELGAGIDAVVGAPANGASTPVLAARLWLAQMRLYARALETYPNAASLDADVLFARPREALAAAYRHFGQPLTAGEIEAIVGGPLFNHYSKNPNRAYDNETRRALLDAQRLELADALREARAWIETQPAAAQLPRQLAKPLVGGGNELLGAA